MRQLVALAVLAGAVALVAARRGPVAGLAPEATFTVLPGPAARRGVPREGPRRPQRGGALAEDAEGQAGGGSARAAPLGAGEPEEPRLRVRARLRVDQDRPREVAPGPRQAGEPARRQGGG